MMCIAQHIHLGAHLAAVTISGDLPTERAVDGGGLDMRLYISLSLYIYIYICMSVCVYIYIYKTYEGPSI